MDGDTMFLVRLKGYDGNPVRDFFCTIGGGLDENEGLIDGVKREILEETGITAEVGKLLCIQQYQDNGDNLEFFFHITNTEAFKRIDLNASTHGLEEIEEFGFYDPKTVELLPEFLQEYTPQQLIDSPETLIFSYPH